MNKKKNLNSIEFYGCFLKSENGIGIFLNPGVVFKTGVSEAWGLKGHEL